MQVLSIIFYTCSVLFCLSVLLLGVSVSNMISVGESKLKKGSVDYRLASIGYMRLSVILYVMMVITFPG